MRQRHLDHEFQSLPEPCRQCLDWQVAGGAEHYQAASS
jgi:hypothetical protein